MNKTFKNIPQYLQWEDGIYEFVANKHNILLYKQEYYDHFDEWSSSKMLIVEHRKDKPTNDSFYVLFCTETLNSSRIHNFDLRNFNRLAKPYNK